MNRNAVMECLSASAFKTVKMLVISNMFRAQNQICPKVITETKTDDTRNSLRVHRTKTQDVGVTTDDKKCLSNSVDAIVTRGDSKHKVICSAKGLLETNLDDLFSDDQSVSWEKNLGASEPTLTLNDLKDDSKRESLVSEDDSVDDSATDSDCLDEVVREQRICLGARRFGHMLRRVISRNGEFSTLNSRFDISDYNVSS